MTKMNKSGKCIDQNESFENWKYRDQNEKKKQKQKYRDQNSFFNFGSQSFTPTYPGAHAPAQDYMDQNSI